MSQESIKETGMDGKAGETRSVVRREYMLHTPDAWVRTPLADVSRGVVVMHCSPQLGAGFVQYTLELEALGGLAPCAAASGVQRFLWVLAGEVEVEDGESVRRLAVGQYCYLPAGFPGGVMAISPSRLSVIEKKYVPLAGVAAPGALFGVEADVQAVPLGGDPGLLVRSLLPPDFDFDFAVNTMTYAPGASLSQVEIHVMEHGLVMLEGEGTYRLGDEGYGVETGDFIWMAPYCPQWFVAEGSVPAKYLIYKDWNRRPRL
jgi:(S)-ureidoglycine aminohydrolase